MTCFVVKTGPLSLIHYRERSAAISFPGLTFVIVGLDPTIQKWVPIFIKPEPTSGIRNLVL